MHHCRIQGQCWADVLRGHTCTNPLRNTRASQAITPYGSMTIPACLALQVETGSAITWKYPSVVLKGDNTVGEFYSVALTNHYQQADTGTKMVHIGRGSRSRIISKGISAGRSRNVYRGQVQVQPTAVGCRNFSQCDSMLIGDTAGANTYPYIQVRPLSLALERLSAMHGVQVTVPFHAASGHHCNEKSLPAPSAASLVTYTHRNKASGVPVLSSML